MIEPRWCEEHCRAYEECALEHEERQQAYEARLEAERDRSGIHEAGSTQPRISQDRRPRSLRWSTALDNHEPTRSFASGTATEYDTPSDPNTRGIRIEDGLEELKDLTNANLIVDDGKSARPYYCAGFHDGRPSPLYPDGHAAYVLFHPFPVNPDGRTRPDNGRMIEYGTWMLGPRRTYHLKIEAAS
jgi:hypothetical protein